MIAPATGYYLHGVKRGLRGICSQRFTKMRHYSARHREIEGVHHVSWQQGLKMMGFEPAGKE